MSVDLGQAPYTMPDNATDGGAADRGSKDFCRRGPCTTTRSPLAALDKVKPGGHFDALRALRRNQ